MWCENLLHAAEANYYSAGQETLHFLQDRKTESMSTQVYKWATAYTSLHWIHILI